MKDDILTELGKYLTPVQCIELRLSMVLPGGIAICMTITNIIQTYNSTQRDEDIVSDLLSKLCKLHFEITIQEI